MKKMVSKTLLSLCILSGAMMCNQLYVNAGCGMSVPAYDGTLMQAAEEGNLNGIKYLLSHSEDPIKDLSETSGDGETALTIAAKNNNEDIVKYIVNRYYKINSYEKEKFLYVGCKPDNNNRHISDMITTAASKGYYSILKYMIFSECKYIYGAMYGAMTDSSAREKIPQMMAYLMRRNFNDAVVYLIKNDVLKFGLKLETNTFERCIDVETFAHRNSDFFGRYLGTRDVNGNLSEEVVRYFSELSIREGGLPPVGLLDQALFNCWKNEHNLTRSATELVNTLLDKFNVNPDNLLYVASGFAQTDMIICALEHGADPERMIEGEGKSSLDFLKILANGRGGPLQRQRSDVYRKIYKALSNLSSYGENYDELYNAME